MDETASTECRPRKPWVAGLLSLWMLGLGQLYCGHWRRTLALWLGGPALLWILALASVLKTFAGLLVACSLGLLYLAWVVWDAVRLARGATSYSLRRFNRWYLYLLLGLASPYAVRPLVAFLPVRAFQVPSSSMEPTLVPGDHLVADMARWRKHAPSRGDLVIYQPPENPQVTVIKRVLAVGGERIEIRHWTVYIDGQPLAHDWGTTRAREPLFGPGLASELPGESLAPIEIPPGHFFAVGDNREGSWDSRFYGPVPNELLRGQPLYLYWAKDRSRIGRRLQ